MRARKKKILNVSLLFLIANSLLINVFDDSEEHVASTSEIYVHTNDVFGKERRQTQDCFLSQIVFVPAFKTLINKNQVTENLAASLKEKDATYMISFHDQRKKGNEIEMRGCSCSFTIAGDCRRYASDTNVLRPSYSLWQVYYKQPSSLFCNQSHDLASRSCLTLTLQAVFL